MSRSSHGLGLDGARLSRRSYAAGADPEVNVNGCDDYLFVLPVSRGHLWLRRESELLHDGPAPPGMVRIVRPGERAALAAQKDFESLLLWLPAKAVHRAAEGFGARADLAPVVLPPRSEMQQLGRSLVTALSASGWSRELMVHGLSMALLALVFEDGSRAKAVPPAAALDDAQWARTVRFADASLGSGLATDGWAAAIGMSSHEFTRRFRARAGVPPYAWFLDRRIERATHLLLHSDRSIVDIALSSGFNSQSHFTDAFRRRNGVPPGRWRAGFGRSQEPWG